MPSIKRHLIIWRNAFALGLIGVGMVYTTRAMAQTISDTTALSFGSFVPGSGGTVVVSTASSRSATGGVTLIISGGGAASQSTVTGTSGSTYSITLPPNGVVSLSDGNGNTMAVDNFVSNPAATSGSTGLLSGGSQTLYVGATLIVTNSQPAGSYSGTFSVTVSYP